MSCAKYVMFCLNWICLNCSNIYIIILLNYRIINSKSIFLIVCITMYYVLHFLSNKISRLVSLIFTFNLNWKLFYWQTMTMTITNYIYYLSSESSLYYKFWKVGLNQRISNTYWVGRSAGRRPGGLFVNHRFPCRLPFPGLAQSCSYRS